MSPLKLIRIGNSIGAVLPKEALARMNLAQGDALFLTDAPVGYRLTPCEPYFEVQMEAARRIMKKRRNVLRELAK